MTKQKTIVVIGALRVNEAYFAFLDIFFSKDHNSLYFYAIFLFSIKKDIMFPKSRK